MREENRAGWEVGRRLTAEIMMKLEMRQKWIIAAWNSHWKCDDGRVHAKAPPDSHDGLPALWPTQPKFHFIS